MSLRRTSSRPGRCSCESRVAKSIDVRAGELVLLPHNDAHVFGSDLNVRRFPRG